MRFKRVLCGIEGSRVIFELPEGGCAMVGIDGEWDGITFNLLPESFMQHMPYDDFVPATELSSETIEVAKAAIGAYNGEVRPWHDHQLSRFYSWMEKNWPE